MMTVKKPDNSDDATDEDYINDKCLKRGLMTRKYSPCRIKSNSDKRLLFAVENKKKHHKCRYRVCSEMVQSRFSVGSE